MKKNAVNNKSQNSLFLSVDKKVHAYKEIAVAIPNLIWINICRKYCAKKTNNASTGKDTMRLYALYKKKVVIIAEKINTD